MSSNKAPCHVNAMLNLCRLLVLRADDNVSAATVAVTEEWLGLLGASAAGQGPRVRFEATPNVTPSEHGRAADMAGFLEAVCTRMAGPFERLLDRLAPSAIVSDAFVPWTVDVGRRRGVPVCVLYPISATMFAAMYNFHRLPPLSPAADDVNGNQSALMRAFPGLVNISSHRSSLRSCALFCRCWF
jgi:hypothetical protein